MTNWPVTPGELVDTTWLNSLVRRYIAPRTTAVDINTSIAEKSLYDGAAVGATTGWKVSANTLGIDRILRLSLIGSWLHNNGASDTVTFRVRWGNAAVIATASTPLNNGLSATRFVWSAEVCLANLGAANAQHIWMKLNVGVGVNGSVGLVMWSPTSSDILFSLAANQVLDTTVNQYLDVSGQWSVSSVNNSLKVNHASCEVLG